MMKRRTLLLALAAGATSAPLRLFAQQQVSVRRFGFFYAGSRQSALETGRYAAFLQGMLEFGYVEGKNFVLEARFADGNSDRLSALAAELVRSNVELIVATGTPTYHALQHANVAIPVVTTVSFDPVGDGLAASLARPGGYFTGLSTKLAEVFPKHIELLRLAVPRLSRVAVLLNPSNAGQPAVLYGIRAAARKFGILVSPLDARTPEEIGRAFETMARERVNAAIILNDTLFVQQIRQIAGEALRHQLASTYGDGDYAEAGGLMGYGQNIVENFRRAASFVDKILKGAKPGDLPYELPTRFYLTVNLRTARALGLVLPQELLRRADKVIE